jgi:hypothetical protein
VASVLGLLEAREKKVREEIARLREDAERAQAALGEAERALQRLVDARATVAEVLAEPPSAATEPQRGSVAGPGGAAPDRQHDGVGPAAGLPADRVGAGVASRPGGHALSANGRSSWASGGPGEGRGGAVEGETPSGAGVGSADAAGSVHRARGAGRLRAPGRRPARRPLMSMVIDHSSMASCMAGKVS